MSYKANDPMFPDHPDIALMERTGMTPEEWRDSKKKRVCCPVCGNNLPERLYENDFGDVVGCDECITVKCVSEWD